MLLQRPYVYDIVISDFGREAAIEFLRSVAIQEKRVARQFLRDANVTFFDEYRRIMFVAVADIAFFKRESIGAYVGDGVLTPRILVGFGSDDVRSEVEKQVCRAAVEQALIALRHGYSRIRVIIPCNTLATLGPAVARQFTPEALEQAFRIYFGDGAVLPSIEEIRATQFTTLTVPSLVLDEIVEKHGPDGELLLLGTADAIDAYRAEVERRSLSYQIADLSDSDQRLLNDLVAASIDGDMTLVTQAKQRVEREVIDVHRGLEERLIVVEACTDFELGLGVDSREVLVRRVVQDAYATA